MLAPEAAHTITPQSHVPQHVTPAHMSPAMCRAGNTSRTCLSRARICHCLELRYIFSACLRRASGSSNFMAMRTTTRAPRKGSRQRLWITASARPKTSNQSWAHDSARVKQPLLKPCLCSSIPRGPSICRNRAKNDRCVIGTYFS